MIKIGKINRLKVLKEVNFGIYLDGFDKGEILMPQKYVPQNTKVNDEVDVFIYLDTEDRLVATTETPFAFVDEFAYLECIANTKFGAFLDWGILKNVLSPFREQKANMSVGKYYLVYIYLDNESQRIVASAKIEKFLDNTIPNYTPGQEVDLLVADKTDLGYKVIINNLHSGIVYFDDVFENLNKGDKTIGYIKKVREDDKIDITLHKFGYRKVEDNLDKVINYLKENNRFVNLNDKSDPEDIYKIFSFSKKTFKQIIGALYKQQKIKITEKGIELI